MGLKLVKFKCRIHPCVKKICAVYFRIIEIISLVKGTDSGVANVLPKNGPTPNNISTPANDKGTLRFGS